MNLRIDLESESTCILYEYLSKCPHPWDFPGGPVVKNPLSNAGDEGSIPGWGIKIPHAAGQLSPCTTTTEHTGHH